MPADNAKFALLVVLDDPSVVKGEAFGGTVAGPVFARMASRAANYLDLQPTEEIPPTPGIQKKVALSEASTD